MSRYIDADALIQLGLQDGAYEYVSVQEIADFPAADVVEVVLCKDCVSWQKDLSVDLYGSHYCPRMDTRTMEDDYCSYGERRKDGEIH